jgi:hypothetical protein
MNNYFPMFFYDYRYLSQVTVLKNFSLCSEASAKVHQNRFTKTMTTPRQIRLQALKYSISRCRGWEQKT